MRHRGCLIAPGDTVYGPGGSWEHKPVPRYHLLWFPSEQAGGQHLDRETRYCSVLGWDGEDKLRQTFQLLPSFHHPLRGAGGFLASPAPPPPRLHHPGSEDLISGTQKPGLPSCTLASPGPKAFPLTQATLPLIPEPQLLLLGFGFS